MEEAYESESNVEFCEFITYSYFYLKQTSFVKCTLNIERPPNLHFPAWVSPSPPPWGIHEIRHGDICGTKLIRIHPHWADNRGKTVGPGKRIQKSCIFALEGHVWGPRT